MNHSDRRPHRSTAPRSPSFDWLEARLKSLRQQGLFRELRERSGGKGMVVSDQGVASINFGSNDYLGLAAETRERPLAAAGSGASPLVTGYGSEHARLAEELAAWEKSEAAVLFPSGFAACAGTIAALAGRGDLILSDTLNHASLIDGCRLSKAERFRYPHADAATVDALLRGHRHLFRRAWIVTDSVFSMDGDVAPLQALADCAARWDAFLIVDEAHATGVLGETGRGACEATGLTAEVPIRIGTLSKAIGVQGGFVVGPRLVTDYLVNHARPLIYSTAAPPATVAAARQAVRSIRGEPERRHRVVALARHVRAALQPLDRRIESSDVPIIPVRLGDAARALEVSAQLQQAGLFVPAIRPPTVPPGTARLRISLSAAHRDDQIERLIAALHQILGTGVG